MMYFYYDPILHVFLLQNNKKWHIVARILLEQ